MSASVEKFARRLNRVERDIKNGAVQPRLPYSSIDGGSLQLNDAYGNLQGIVGEQYDGSVTIASVGGTPLPSPSTPLVTPVQGGLAIYWDGTWVDDSVTRMDFRRVTFHAVTDVDDFDAVDPAQIVGEITIATGGEVFATLPPVEYFIFAVGWTDAGVFSFESDVAFGTPLSLVDEAEWQAHEDALENLNTVLIPALQTDLGALDTSLSDLNTVTLPALDSRLGATETVLDDLNNITLPDLQSSLNNAETDVGIVTAQIEDWKTPGQTTIDGGKVAADSVTALQIAALTITAAEIAADTITAAQIAAGAITAVEIAANTITASEIAADAITTTELAANAVTAAKVAANTITAAQIAANTITAAQIAAGTITATEIGANQITAGKIAVDAITSGTIAADAITSKHTITGATFQTSVTAARGIKIVGSVLTAYDGVGNPRFIANGSTGEITVVGKMLTGLTGNKRVEVGTGPSSDPLLGDVSSINFFSGNALETQAAQIVTGTTPGALYITSGRRSDTPVGVQVPNINLFTPTGTGPTQLGGIDILAGGNFNLSSTNQGSVSTSAVDYIESSVTVVKGGVRVRSGQNSTSPDILLQARGDTVIQYSSDADVANKAVVARFNKDLITFGKPVTGPTEQVNATNTVGGAGYDAGHISRGYRFGKTVMMTVDSLQSGASGPNARVATLPVGYRPPFSLYFTGYDSASGAEVLMFVQVDGGIYTAPPRSAGSSCGGSFVFLAP